MTEPKDAAFESELHICSLMIEQIKANARVLFGCRLSYDVVIGHGDDGGYRAMLFRHNHNVNTDDGDDDKNNNNKTCAADGPKGTKFSELRQAHALLRMGFAPTRRAAVRSVLDWTEGLVSGTGV
ncbi:uncharacterized protein BKCO1_2100071 [Diplodia corticola]|uniref:Uncharacterized protein n=1 Tax=Diplodia corticola TaxID=236234 RepID=A0A1J9R202_9PEZI|nr:uncharacterized protein BKCO1_2100071 [Diplodia corticola]OJD34664.1 hypothetical protein BKCO1_2100071 [Diplodia corticola]